MMLYLLQPQAKISFHDSAVCVHGVCCIAQISVITDKSQDKWIIAAIEMGLCMCVHVCVCVCTCMHVFVCVCVGQLGYFNHVCRHECCV